jgi:anti-sigma regulatory factor (Ser/Thr protein kinase)
MSQVFEVSVKADLENLKEVRSFINQAGLSLGVHHDIVGDLCLVVDEAVTNVILHGYDGVDGSIDIQLEPDGDNLVIRIRDQARNFDADQVETPHLDESLSERAFGGMGVYLIKKLTDEATFRSLPGGGNELSLIKFGAIPG